MVNDDGRPVKQVSISIKRIGLVLLGVMVLDAFAMITIYLMISDGNYQLAALVAAITLMLNIIWLHPKGYPLRWMSPGLSFMILISIFPVFMTIYFAFTNYGTGHILSKTQAISVFEKQTFLPDKGITYDYTVYQNGAGDYGLWLQSESQQSFFVLPGKIIEDLTVILDKDGIPLEIEGYQRLTQAQALKASVVLADIKFGSEQRTVIISTRPGKATQFEQRYVYNSANDTLYDHRDGIEYFANNVEGAFISKENQKLIPGYRVSVGLNNFDRFISTPSYRAPLLRIFLWTFAYASLTVLLAFSFGLMIAIFFGRNMPFSRLIKSLFIIPFAIPSVLTILIWRGLLNPLNGLVSTTLAGILNQPVGWPPVFSDPLWVKIALIGVNVWLAYPYFMLINSGALQAIPQDIYEAADIDGANPWQRFIHLTLPLLLISVGPLVIGSFIANFNSFNTIYLFNDGGPPMVGTATPAGHSDILLSYVYRLAFSGGGGQDFGYASAITMIIFFILLLFTFVQFRYMRIWERVGENV